MICQWTQSQCPFQSSPMISRRTLLVSASATLFSPNLMRAQSSALDDAISGLTQLHSLQVQQGDDVLYAKSPRGRGLNTHTNIKSCSKSLVALLLGSVIDRAEISSISATLEEVAPNLIPAGAEEGVGAITMEDLVTLRAGLERTSGGNYGAWVASSNWIADALSRPMVARPGGRMLYSTGSTHVLGAALSRATGQSLLSLARERIGRPMQIDIPPWTRDPQGNYMGGNEMALRPTDMLKIAVMMRDGGQYGGRRVIPTQWIEASAQPRARSPWSGLAYGYGWFLSDSGYVLARGYGGQIIAAHPQRNLAVAITSDPTQPARSDGHFGALMALLEGPVLALA